LSSRLTAHSHIDILQERGALSHSSLKVELRLCSYNYS